MRTLVACLIAVLISASAGRASEADALAISANIQARHFPFASILDPIYASPTSDQIVAYTRCGDSSLWTGAYLAAESFRYKVTQSADALKNVKSALAGLKALSDLTGTNQLARCIVPIDSPYAAGIAHEEDANTVHSNPPWLWIGNPSRDQIVGAFFGLNVAFDMVDDADVKSGASDLATRLIGYISRHQWSPTDDAGNSFQTRPEELQMLLQVARHLNPANTVSGPFFVLPVSTGVEFDVLSLTSYFKFNLDYMTFYHLIRLQDNGDNRGAYTTARNYTASHQNAFFNMVDRALRGPDAARDSETRTLLDQWLQRSRRDFYVDDSSKVPVCGDRACQPIPVPLRGPATFLWEVDPFQLKGGGSGVVESAGVDYILPYWMARYYGVIAQSGIQSAAAPTNAIASASLASLYGQNLASTTAQAGSLPLPLSLGGINLVATDSAGMARNVPLLYVSPTQINFLVPDGMAGGSAVFVVGGGPATQSFPATLQPVAPALFSMNGTGSGVAAALAVSLQVPTSQQSPVPVFQCTDKGCVSVPIDVGVDRPVYVSFYGTGIRNAASPSNATVSINGVTLPALYAGPSPNYAGLDQVNVALPLSLRGAGEAKVVLTIDGQTSNAVTINIQ